MNFTEEYKALERKREVEKIADIIKFALGCDQGSAMSLAETYYRKNVKRG